MRRSNCAGALQYVPELTWMLFLRILDEQEEKETEITRAVGASFSASLDYPYRWQDWAAPGGNKRVELQKGTFGGFMRFVDSELIPYVHGQRICRERCLKNQRYTFMIGLVPKTKELDLKILSHVIY